MHFLQRARRIIALKEKVHGNFLYDQGVAWLKQRHGEGTLTMGQADKGYGFCIIHSNTIHSQTLELLESGSFSKFTFNEFLYQTWQHNQWLNWKLDNGVLRGIISKKCRDHLIQPFVELQLQPGTSSEDNVNLLGKIRYMAKLHKLPSLKFRRVESDLHNWVFGQVGCWSAGANCKEPALQHDN